MSNLPFQFKFKEAGIDMSQMKKLDARQELLVITMEECGELIQACSKAIRCDDYHDNEKLIEESGDVMCMIELLQQYDLVSYQEIDERVIEKRNKLRKWSNLL